VLASLRGLRLGCAASATGNRTRSATTPITARSRPVSSLATRAAWSRLSWLAVSTIASGASRGGPGRRRTSRARTARGALIAAARLAQDRVERADRILDNCCDGIAGA